MRVNISGAGREADFIPFSWTGFSCFPWTSSPVSLGSQLELVSFLLGVRILNLLLSLGDILLCSVSTAPVWRPVQGGLQLTLRHV